TRASFTGRTSGTAECRSSRRCLPKATAGSSIPSGWSRGRNTRRKRKPFIAGCRRNRPGPFSKSTGLKELRQSLRNDFHRFLESDSPVLQSECGRQPDRLRGRDGLRLVAEGPVVPGENDPGDPFDAPPRSSAHRRRFRPARAPGAKRTRRPVCRVAVASTGDLYLVGGGGRRGGGCLSPDVSDLQSGV